MSPRCPGPKDAIQGTSLYRRHLHRGRVWKQLWEVWGVNEASYPNHINSEGPTTQRRTSEVMLGVLSQILPRNPRV